VGPLLILNFEDVTVASGGRRMICRVAQVVFPMHRLKARMTGRQWQEDFKPFRWGTRRSKGRLLIHSDSTKSELLFQLRKINEFFGILE
jgi:hypothetical protein